VQENSIKMALYVITALVSKQIHTECLFDVPLPFFRRIKSTIEKNSLFTFALFASSNSQILLNTLSRVHIE
jgi:hypothetical protein